MKYTIYGYSQEKLNNQGIDLESALILRVVADLYTCLLYTSDAADSRV